MRKLGVVATLVVLVALMGSAWAELQEVRVGGEIRIRGRVFNNGFAAGNRLTPYNPALFSGRALGPFGITSVYGWDSDFDDRCYIEQRTAVHVEADFTDEVSARIELHDFAIWGEDFRSNYVTGVDGRAVSNDDIEVYQAYVEVRNLYGYPVRSRVGRQEIVMGEGWLIGNMISPTLGLSFDGSRWTYETDMLTVDAFGAKLAESFGDWGSDDVNLYGIYGTYKGLEAVDISAFWFAVQDDIAIDDSPNSTWGVDWWEDVVGVNQYDTTWLHTIGMRFDGSYDAFDYDAKFAYQFGDAYSAGSGFNLFTIYGDDDADYDFFAYDVELGYTFDMKWTPRVYLGSALYEGEDNRDLSFWEWLNPFRAPQASLAFNRLFSKYWYTATSDILGGASAMSNFWQVRGGVSVNPTEKISSGLKLAYFWADEPMDLPRSWDLGFAKWYTPFPFRTEEADDDLGFVTTLWLKYNYSEDWFVSVGWEHFFTDDGITDGNYIFKNGLEFSGGTDNDDADYIWVDTGVKF